VLATGWCDQPRISAVAHNLSPSITQLTANEYRNAAALPPGASSLSAHRRPVCS
jgi:hypothetical protein